jgi:hypothetical protein
MSNGCDSVMRQDHIVHPASRVEKSVRVMNKSWFGFLVINELIVTMADVFLALVSLNRLQTFVGIELTASKRKPGRIVQSFLLLRWIALLMPAMVLLSAMR